MIHARIRFTLAVGIAFTNVVIAIAQESTHTGASQQSTPDTNQILDQLIEHNQQLEKQNRLRMQTASSRPLKRPRLNPAVGKRSHRPGSPPPRARAQTTIRLDTRKPQKETLPYSENSIPAADLPLEGANTAS
jgi:hypothetical protein